MNIHINKHTRFQNWDKKTIFDEYPLHIRTGGKFTVTLLFHDTESLERMNHMLGCMLFEIEEVESENPIIEG